MKPFQHYVEARDWLYGLRNRGSKYGIDRMRSFAVSLGNPQQKFPIIHVAGTNGKGSVCAMLENVYRNSGLKTGLFCSPHLLHQGERIKVNGKPMTEEELLCSVNTLLPYVDSIIDEESQPTFFELMTGMAFQYFAQNEVDLGIFETGLGGRLDSTNIVEPLISVITSIGLDHVEILGNTLEQIAFEKGGIIKKNVPIVLGKIPEAAKEVLTSIAKDTNSKVHSVEERFSNESLPQTNLSGEVQRWNAGTARLTCEILNDTFPVSKNSLNKGLNSVELLGRWTKLRIQDRQVILDGAHNEEAANALVSNLEVFISEAGIRPIIIVGFTGSKVRANAFIPKIEPLAEKIIKVVPIHERGIDQNEYGPNFMKGIVSEIFPSKGICNVNPPGHPVLVTGSLYLIAEVLERLLGKSENGQQRLQD